MMTQAISVMGEDISSGVMFEIDIGVGFEDFGGSVEIGGGVIVGSPPNCASTPL